MADDVTLPGTGEVVAADEVGGKKYQRVKLAVGADGAAADNAADQPIHVRLSDGATSLATLPVSLASVPSHAVTNAGTFAVQAADGGGSLTVDAPVGTPVFVRLSDGTDPITPGTEYTEGDTDATIKGAACLAEAPSDTLAVLQLDAALNLLVNLATALPAGTNNIGDVDVLTQPARAATTDSIAAKLATDKILDGTTALTPKFKAIAASSSGLTEVVAAVTSKKIRVLGYRFQAAGDVGVKFRDDTAGVDLTGVMPTGAKGGGGGAAFSPVGHFETAAGNALSINLSDAVAVGGHVAYLEV